MQSRRIILRGLTQVTLRDESGAHVFDLRVDGGSLSLVEIREELKGATEGFWSGRDLKFLKSLNIARD